MAARLRHWMGASGAIAAFRALAVVVPALAAVAPRVTVPALVAAVFVLLLALAAERRRPPLPGLAVMLGFLALMAWAATSGAWASGPVARSVTMVFSTIGCGLFLIAAAQQGAPRALLEDALVFGVGIGLAIYAFEAISGAWLTRLVHGLDWPAIIDPLLTGGVSVHAYLINGTAILSLLLWPAATVFVRRGHWQLAIVLGALVAATTVWFGSDTGLLALALGAGAWGASAWMGGRAAQIAAVLFVLLVMGTPFSMLRVLAFFDATNPTAESSRISSSATERLVIWKFTTERIAERPLLGWGFDVARRIPGGSEAFVVRMPDGRAAVRDVYLPLHPHNQVLQVWLELGAIGALIVAAIGGMLIWRIGGLDPPLRHGALALAGSVIVYDYLSFGAWQNWWIAAVFIAAALHSAVSRDTVRS